MKFEKYLNEIAGYTMPAKDKKIIKDFVYNDATSGKGKSLWIDGDYLFAPMISSETQYVAKRGKNREITTGIVFGYNETVMKFEKYLIENKNYDSLMKDMEKTLELEKKIHEYPTMASIINFINDINTAKGKKLINLTNDFDRYCKLGLAWNIRGMNTDIVEKAYNFAIEKRKTAFPKYDLTAINNAIKFFLGEYNNASKKGWQSAGTLKELLGILSEIEDLLAEPWRVGLEEETQFPTLKREISWSLNYAKKQLKKQYETFAWEKLQEFEKDIKALKKS